MHPLVRPPAWVLARNLALLSLTYGFFGVPSEGKANRVSLIAASNAGHPPARSRLWLPVMQVAIRHARDTSTELRLNIGLPTEGEARGSHGNRPLGV